MATLRLCFKGLGFSFGGYKYRGKENGKYYSVLGLCKVTALLNEIEYGFGYIIIRSPYTSCFIY